MDKIARVGLGSWGRGCLRARYQAPLTFALFSLRFLTQFISTTPPPERVPLAAGNTYEAKRVKGVGLMHPVTQLPLNFHQFAVSLGP